MLLTCERQEGGGGREGRIMKVEMGVVGLRKVDNEHVY